MYRLILILIVSSSISQIASHPDPSSENQESASYKADDSLNKVSDDIDSPSIDTTTTDNLVLSGVKNMLVEEKPEDLVDSIAKTILEYAKINSKPKSRRANSQDPVQPEIVHFDHAKPSVMLKMNTTSLVDMLANALKSKTVISYVQHYSRRAAQAVNIIQQKMEDINS